MDIYTTKLSDVPEETWDNIILWRLAVAAGLVEKGAGEVVVDQDALLEAAEKALREARGA